MMNIHAVSLDHTIPESVLPVTPDENGVQPSGSFPAELQSVMFGLCQAYANISSAIQLFGKMYDWYCAATQQENDFAETLSWCMKEAQEDNN